MKKTEAEYFRDWENHAFGYGYGTGEPYTLAAIKMFLENCNHTENHGYDHQKLEAILGPVVTWLLISRFCQLMLINYGGSPRGGWLEGPGVLLKEFVSKHTVEELVEIVTDFTPMEYAHCDPGFCNCGDEVVIGKVCPNPFWSR